MSIVLHLFVSVVLLAPSLVLAATLETPGNGDNLSGIGVIRGWKCEAVGDITVVIDGGSPISMTYGNERGDVRNAGGCSSAHVGFVSIWNYGELDSGEHTAVAYDNGVEFARSTFEVTTLGTSFLRGARGEGTVFDFPELGTDVVLKWQEAQQSFVIEEVTDSGDAAGWCCRYVRDECSFGVWYETEYDWRDPQTRGRVCARDPEGSIGLVAIWSYRPRPEAVSATPQSTSDATCFETRKKWIAKGYRMVGLEYIFSYEIPGEIPGVDGEVVVDEDYYFPRNLVKGPVGCGGGPSLSFDAPGGTEYAGGDTSRPYVIRGGRLDLPRD